MNNKIQKTSWVIYTTILGVAFYGLYLNSHAFAAKNETSSDGVLGNKASRVTVIEYGDYQCPYCALYHQRVEVPLIKNYVDTGKIKLIFKNQQFLGVESVAAGTAALCAKEQGKFWPYHEALYQGKLNDLNSGGTEGNGFYNRSLFIKLASEVGLNVKAFTTCYDSNKYVTQVQKESDEASNAGVNATPSVFVNDQRVSNPLSYDEVKAAIDEALKK